MNGLRPLLPTGILTTLLLTACGSRDLPPPAGSLTASDPQAGAAFARAQAAESAGDLKQATKLYEEVAEDHPYSEVAPQARFRQAALLEKRGELLDAFDAYQAFLNRYQGSALYSKALANQAVVAHAAADGVIKNRFLGIRSRLDTKKIAEMLAQVRDNAPQAPSAAKAQFAIGELWEGRNRRPEAITAYQVIIDEYPASPVAPEAQYRIGAILLGRSERGNQNPANLDKARFAFEDLLQRYPNSIRSADARARIAEIQNRNIQRNFDIAEFYFKKGQLTSATFYYEEVRRESSGGPLHQQATARLAQINGQ